ncbi:MULTISPECIES: oxidoreductase family protein [unclassified Shewanella]|uniref:oxidoreductase family protein n=1 Tax=unclassified Shewanella TaxID=196818 RepID=UPI001BBD6E8E|nr:MULTISPECIES: oxidoreductase family protein [unclassified Shewanella]GIU10602.1 phosphotransferase [Shewanella sp. MBTL60-112-B1]GIU40281.1 phosphotransferase [Shewanella sp. MBTL60-112-B2]
MNLNNASIDDVLTKFFGSPNFEKKEIIQSLWSGYGEIARYRFTSQSLANNYGNRQFIVKHITPPNEVMHPRGWASSVSHQRKLDSYQIEVNFYKHWAKLCNDNCLVPTFLGECSFTKSEQASQLILMSDLDCQGFQARATVLSLQQIKLCIRWLAHFHARFLSHSKSLSCEGLWPIGSYWHLSTRQDEWQVMPESSLKVKAAQIDKLLNNCEYKTIIHGDAKVTNFCFTRDYSDVAAVDFQYVGSGVGVKDLIYLIGSCLTERDCETSFSKLVNEYFELLEQALCLYQPHLDPILVTKEWRSLVDLAWADFERFLVGWAPNHQKRNQFSQNITQRALSNI